MKPVNIAGAGLAGLALGYALQRADIPTTIHEAGTLPRHRVCGEFLCGRGAAALNALGLQGALEGALEQKEVHWHLGDNTILRAVLPSPAYGISRYPLDQRLADRYRELGGQLIERSRWTDRDAEGLVGCSGRQATKSEWIGLKLHCTNLQTQADLELHLGENGYLGMSGIESDRVNVCGLFKRRPNLTTRRENWLPEYLRACGLSRVAARIEESSVDSDSHAGVAGVDFAQPPGSQPDRLSLGDAYSVMPPFTGNGMSVALESAEIALPDLLAYARERQTWQTTITRIHQQCGERFNSRLRSARRLHPWITRPAGQRTLATLCRLHLLPFQFLYNRTH